MNQKALELYLYMGSSDQIIKWLKSEGVTTRQGAKDKLAPLVGNNLRSVASHIGAGNYGVSMAGTANCLERVLKTFPEGKQKQIPRLVIGATPPTIKAKPIKKTIPKIKEKQAMTKKEFYNKVVEIYQKTGQGTPDFLRAKLGDKIIDELIQEGKLKLVVTKFNHLPDDRTLCLTKGYCVEDHTQGNNLSALFYMRVYRGIDEISRIGAERFMLKDAIKNVEFMEKYVVWLKENEKQLTEKIDDYVGDGSSEGDKLTDKEIKFLWGRNLFKNNRSINRSIERINELIDVEGKLIVEYDNIIQYSKKSKSYKEKIPKYEKEQRLTKSRLRKYNSIKSWLLLAKNKKQGIKDYFESEFPTYIHQSDETPNPVKMEDISPITDPDDREVKDIRQFVDGSKKV